MSYNTFFSLSLNIVLTWNITLIMLLCLVGSTVSSLFLVLLIAHSVIWWSFLPHSSFLIFLPLCFLHVISLFSNFISSSVFWFSYISFLTWPVYFCKSFQSSPLLILFIRKTTGSTRPSLGLLVLESDQLLCNIINLLYAALGLIKIVTRECIVCMLKVPDMDLSSPVFNYSVVHLYVIATN